MVEQDQSARNSHAHRSGLPAHPAALDGTVDIELLEGLGKVQRLDCGGMPGHVAKILLHWPAVHGELAGTRLDVNAGHGLAAASRAVVLLTDCGFQSVRCSAQNSSCR